MIIPDEIMIGAIGTIGGFMGWMIKYMVGKFETVITSNTAAFNQLVIVMQDYQKQEKKV